MLQPLFTNSHYVGREGDKEKEVRGKQGWEVEQEDDREVKTELSKKKMKLKEQNG